MKFNIDSRGGSPADENAPVFVWNAMELASYAGPLGENRATTWSGYFMYGALPLYLLAFAAAESWFPGLYRAWADLVLPLAEFAGSLTPRTVRITEQLISNGYPERAEFAMHAIAMSRAIVLPFVLSVLVAVFVAVARTQRTPFVAVCTRKTRMHYLLLSFGIPVVMFLFMLTSELAMGEDFGDTSYWWNMDDYHRGNYAIFYEGIAAMWIGFSSFVIVYAPVLGLRTHFHIVEKEPEY